MTTEQILNFIDQNPQFDLKAVSFSKKITNGQFTEEPCLTLQVGKKKPLHEVPVDEIIPTGVYIDGFGWVKTDVTQGEVFSLACSDCDISEFSSDTDVASNVQRHREAQRPLLGGVSINAVPSGVGDWGDPESISKNIHPNNDGVGTFGFIAVDELDGSLVGVTNHHVVAYNYDTSVNGGGTYAHQRISNSARFGAATENYNFHGHKIQNAGHADFRNQMKSIFCQSDTFYGDYLAGRASGVLEIGYLKRYFPVATGNNTIDAAIIGLHSRSSVVYQRTLTQSDSCEIPPNPPIVFRLDSHILDENSWMILGHDVGNQKYYPFASTQEINSMTSTDFLNAGTATNPNVCVAGRTSGLKGQPRNPNASRTNDSCIYRIESINTVVSSLAIARTTGRITDSITFRWRNCTNLNSILPGDSGSTLLGKFNGIWKIVGLIYALSTVEKGGSGLAYACRIDFIAPLLKIRPYVGQSLTNSNPPAWQKPAEQGKTLIVKNKQSLPFFTHTDGRTYYQMGTTSTAANLTSLS